MGRFDFEIERPRVLHCPDRRLRAIGHVYLPKNRFHMNLNRGFRDIVGSSNELVGVTEGKAVQDLALASG
jgi:hypothetical protein